MTWRAGVLGPGPRWPGAHPVAWGERRAGGRSVDGTWSDRVDQRVAEVPGP